MEPCQPTLYWNDSNIIFIPYCTSTLPLSHPYRIFICEHHNSSAYYMPIRCSNYGAKANVLHTGDDDHTVIYIYIFIYIHTYIHTYVDIYTYLYIMTPIYTHRYFTVISLTLSAYYICIFNYLYIDSFTHAFGWSAFLCRMTFRETLVVIFF
jgi:hypothetical protein